jgi:hypothetical protein
VRTIAVSKLLYILLGIIWASHFIQVFVPETGFDALWYHLPVAKAIVEHSQLIYLPDLYQSANPLFSDLLFTTGYWLLGDIGTKIVAYLFGLSLIGVSYLLARKYLSKAWSLLCVTLISTFQVISWQSASFYIDVAKAFFEITSLLFLYRFLFEGSLIIKNTNEESIHSLVISAITFGASLATKLFSIFLLPVYVLLTWLFSQSNKIKNSCTFLLGALILPLPFYIFTYVSTGNAFYSFVVHINKLGQIGGESNFFSYLISRTLLLPSSLVELFIATDYVSFIFIIFLPIIIYNYQKVVSKQHLFLLLFSLAQYLIWWYLPPQSSRYALSGFITLAILYFSIIAQYTRVNTKYLWPVVCTILLSICINFAPRVLVNLRSLPYVLQQQTKEDYLKQFMDGSIDKNIKEWHFTATP